MTLLTLNATVGTVTRTRDWTRVELEVAVDAVTTTVIRLEVARALRVEPGQALRLELVDATVNPAR